MPSIPHFRTCRPKARMLGGDALHGDRSGFAAADAKCRDAALQILRLQRVQQGYDQPRPGRADGLAERAGAAIYVELLTGSAEVLLPSHPDHRKGLLDLEQIDIADLPADLVEQLADRRNRRRREPLRL